MMKMNKKVLNSSLVILLALGLGGCAVGNSTTTSHKSHEASSSQVVKQNHKKSAKSASTTAKNATATNHSTSANVTSSSNSASSAKNVTNASSTNTTQQVTAPAKAATSSSSIKEQKSVQLGLGDVATWTDSKGVTHNVDSDGMDRYTTNGSSQVQYKDWSGALPSGVTVSHNN